MDCYNDCGFSLFNTVKIWFQDILRLKQTPTLTPLYKLFETNFRLGINLTERNS